MNDANAAVVRHLISMIQTNADVRYYVGGFGSRMRELLVEAIQASGFDGDPLDALKPPEHRKDEQPHFRQLQARLGRFENGVEEIREALAHGHNERARFLVEKLQGG